MARRLKNNPQKSLEAEIEEISAKIKGVDDAIMRLVSDGNASVEVSIGDGFGKRRLDRLSLKDLQLIRQTYVNERKEKEAKLRSLSDNEWQIINVSFV